MLHTLQKLGRIELESRGEYDGLVWSTEDLTDKKGTSRAVEIRIDLDAPVGERVSFGDFFSIEEIDAEWLWNRGGVKMASANTSSHYFAVKPKNSYSLFKTLFGKGLNDSPQLKGWSKGLEDDEIRLLLTTINAKDIKDGLLKILGGPKKKSESALRKSHPDLSEKDRIALLYTTIKGEKLDLNTFTPLAQIGNYLEIYNHKKKNSSLPKKPRLCHLNGTLTAPGTPPKYDDRKNINKIFVTTTFNYANNLDKNNFINNFALNAQTKYEVEVGGDLLKEMECNIAGIRHYIIPRWIDEGDFSKNDLAEIQSIVELTLNLSSIENLIATLQDGRIIETPYSITLLGFHSDGQSIKVTSIIQDVPNFHFSQILQIQRRLSEQLSPLSGKFPFRLNSIYRLVPLIPRPAKKKGNSPSNKNFPPRNEALQLIKSVLERRPIDESVLWRHFTRLALCHRYARYKKHTNVYDPKKADAQETMDRGMLNAVNGYWILRIFLHRLGLLANTTLSDQSSFTLNPSDMNDRDYPKQMQMTKRQEALFHLGRALNHMAHAQAQRNNSKRILQKLNFNGMDRDAIRRLSIDLAENALVYKSKKPKYDTVHDELRYPLSRFEAGFDHNTWNESNEFGRPVGEEEALFYILSGCHFIPAKADADDQDDTPQA